jgi:YihY family inner membrane protein
MSSARRVPETYELNGDDARETLRRAKVGLLLKDAFVRLRLADGFSHARALAFQLVLALIPGVIVAVGVATMLEESEVATLIRGTLDSLAPGPAGDIFRAAFEQGAEAGNGDHIAVVVGGLALLIAAVTTFGQIERAANRLYGVERDRPTLKKYFRATLLALSAGVLIGAFLILATFGRNVGDSLEDTGASLWQALRWPVGLLILLAALALVFRFSPARRQPGLSWLAVGAGASLIGILAVTGLLHAYINASQSLGDTYGPLAGFIGLMLWALLSSIALVDGLSFAAQLEAFRAGVPDPQRTERVEDRPAAGLPV